MVLKIEFSGNHFHLTVKKQLWPRKFISVPIFTSNDFRSWDAQRELTDAQRENEREKEGSRERAKGERSRCRSWSRLRIDRDLAKHRVDRDLAKRRSRLRLREASISRSTAPISPSPPPCDLARRRTQSPLSLPSSLNLTGFDDFFFWVLSVFLYWGMNDITYLFGNRETVRKCDWIWPNLMIFFLGFVCVSVLRNEWYNIFVWQPRKCEKMWATSRKCVFYGIFKNTTKYQKIFFEIIFEMQQNTWKHFPFRKIAFPENWIFSGNTFTRTKHNLILKIKILRIHYKRY